MPETETKKETSKERKISAGNYDLNVWLHGGYDKDIITTIYGPAGSGKTNLCLLAAASRARKGEKVIFVDTEGGFSIDRLKQLSGEDFEKIAANIILLKATSFNEQEKAFSQLVEQIEGKEHIGLIIIDGMTMLYRLELAAASKSKDENKIRIINSKLAGMMKMLNEIARKQLIPIIVTNQVYAEFLPKETYEAGAEKKVAMVGGDILKYWSKCIIELQNLGQKKKAILRKHRSLPEKEFYFVITQNGIARARRFF